MVETSGRRYSVAGHEVGRMTMLYVPVRMHTAGVKLSVCVPSVCGHKNLQFEQ